MFCHLSSRRTNIRFPQTCIQSKPEFFPPIKYMPTGLKYPNFVSLIVSFSNISFYIFHNAIELLKALKTDAYFRGGGVGGGKWPVITLHRTLKRHILLKSHTFVYLIVHVLCMRAALKRCAIRSGFPVCTLGRLNDVAPRPAPPAPGGRQQETPGGPTVSLPPALRSELSRLLIYPAWRDIMVSRALNKAPDPWS